MRENKFRTLFDAAGPGEGCCIEMYAHDTGMLDVVSGGLLAIENASTNKKTGLPEDPLTNSDGTKTFEMFANFSFA